MTLTTLSDDALVSQLQTICLDKRRLLGRLLIYLVEVEDRRLHLKAACPSLFEFCRRRLAMSEGEAYRRINAARLVQKFPSLLGRIERGEIHLSSLALLRDHLTAETVEERVEAAAGKTKREVEELIARWAPRPDVPATIRKLPTPTGPASRATPSSPSASPEAALPPKGSPRPPPRANLEPLSPARYRLQLTVTAELYEKLELARDSMRHINPTGDLAIVVERAVDTLLVEIQKRTHGKTARPQPTPRKAKPSHVERAVRQKRQPSDANPRHVARAARREVYERDGARCTFTDAEGHRCPSRAFLELDHIESHALGGSSEATNLRVRCRAHNQLHAEEVFGRDHIAIRAHFRQRRSGLSHGSPPLPRARS